MTVSLSTVHILVDDPDAALGFYRDTLGLTVRNEVANGGFRWITLVTNSQPEIAIVLSQPHAGRSQEDGDALAVMLAKGEMYPVHFRTDDLDATFDKIANAPGVVPKPGDLIVFGDEHVGIVRDVLPDGQIQTIEGNYENKVAANVRTPTEATGYVNMN